MACYTVSTMLLRQDQIYELFIFMRTKIINFLKFKIKSVNIFKKLYQAPDFLVKMTCKNLISFYSCTSAPSDLISSKNAG